MEEDDPFALIERGNAFEAASNQWGSADMYSRASMCLRIRADNISMEDDVKKQERRKIISLYRAQSLEYLYKARHCFIEAVKFENDQDRSRMLKVAKSGRGKLDPTCMLTSSEESERRRNIFQILFSGQQEDVKAKEVHHDVDDKKEDCKSNTGDEKARHAQNDINESTITPAEDNIDNLQESMEARLAKLNSSLANNENIPKAPPPFISGSRSGGGGGGIDDQSRLDNLQRGLKGLGVTLPYNSRNKNFIPENLSDEDQVKLIIQQAQDEVMIEKGNEVDNTDYINNDDEDDSMFEGFEDEEDDIESLLAKAENLVAKTTSDHPSSSIPSSTVELAQLRKAQALLLEARLCLEIGDAKDLNEDANNEMNDESTSSNGGNLNDDNGAEADNMEETDNQRNESKRNSIRIKAKERVEDADRCLKDILSGWRE